MKTFKNLLDFVGYCEMVLEDSNDLFIIAMIASHLTEEEMLVEVEVCLEVYYFWLKQAIASELYLLAGCIVNAKESEIEHYFNLASAVLKKNINKEIIEIDKKLNKKHL